MASNTSAYFPPPDPSLAAPGVAPAQPTPGLLARSKHPVAMVFHLLFKVLGLLAYLFCYLLTDDFVLTFVLCILLMAFDFWTVKNVSGRLLVGLRWWNDIKEDGSNEWIFESSVDPEAVNPSDSRVFWIATIVSPIAWGALLFVSIVGLHFIWALVCFIGCSLGTANLVGYWKCRKDAKQKLKSMLGQAAVSALASNMLDKI
eukprot:GILI01012914.1.p1 GENE.GILI01012914.1~~GILI01012914.1.p1  ORF type:complete len:202 (+),score=59.55 GILI01012914.1:140-745(+)